MAYYPIYQQAYGLYGNAPALPALATPANAQATATSSTSLSVTASSVANAAGYQLYTSATQTGAYAKLGGVLTTPSYSHTGLSAGQTQWYKWVAVGDGVNYRDSAQTAAFSGTTASGTAPIAPTVSFDSTTRTLTATHSLGTNEIVYQRNNGPVQPYAPIMVDNNDHPVGEWKFFTRAVSGRPAGAVQPSPKIDPAATGPVVIPADRTAKIALSDNSFDKAGAAMQRVVDRIFFTFSNGDQGVSPGLGNIYYNGGGPVGSPTEFARMWVRDAFFFFRAYLDHIPAAMLIAWQDRLLAAALNGRIPDRIRADGVVERTPFSGVLNSPYDNNFFTIQQELLIFQKTGSIAHFISKRTQLEAVYAAIPKQNGLVHIPAQTLGQPLTDQDFGFLDSEARSGFPTHGIGNQYGSAIAFAKMTLAASDNAAAQTWVDEAATIKAAFNDPATGLWDDAYGMFRSATDWGKEVCDLPGNALAVTCGLADNDKALRISQKIADRITDFFRGQVPHGFADRQALPGISLWRFYIGPSVTFQVVDDNGNRVPYPNGQGFYSGADAATSAPYGEYQNFGKWYTFLDDILPTLSLTNATAAKQLLYDAVYSANLDPARDNVECSSLNGAFRCNLYAASAAAIYRLIKGGDTDPAGVTPDPDFAFEENESGVNSASNSSVRLWINGPNWQDTTSLDPNFSGGLGSYIANGLTDIRRLPNVRILSPKYMRFVCPTTSSAGITQMAMVAPGAMPGTADWIDVDLYSATPQPFAVRGVSPAAYAPGLYDICIRQNPGNPANRNLGLHDRIELVDVP